MSLQPGIFGETPGVSFPMTKAAPVLPSARFLWGLLRLSAAFVNHLDNVHSQWLMAKNPSLCLPLRIGKGLCMREKMASLSPPGV